MRQCTDEMMLSASVSLQLVLRPIDHSRSVKLCVRFFDFSLSPTQVRRAQAFDDMAEAAEWRPSRRR